MLMMRNLGECYFMLLHVIHKLDFLHRQDSFSFGLLFYVSFCERLVQP